MDFQTIITWVLGLVETGALLAALMYATVAMKSKKDKKKQGDAGQAKRKAAIALAVYLILTVIRNHGTILEMFDRLLG
nr:hypothetical protein [Oscillospiraceae bacterium]